MERGLINQYFELAITELDGELEFENGATKTFTYGDQIFIPNASAFDTALPGFNFDADIDFGNLFDSRTFLSFDTGFKFTLLELAIVINLAEVIDVIDETFTLFEENITLNEFLDLIGIVVPKFDLFNDQFELNVPTEPVDLIII